MWGRYLFIGLVAGAKVKVSAEGRVFVSYPSKSFAAS